MSTISEKLQKISAVKTDVKNILSSTYYPMDNLTFEEYPSSLSTILDMQNNGDTYVWIDILPNAKFGKKHTFASIARYDTTLPVYIDWGDGNVTELNEDVPLYASPNHSLIEHTYSDFGKYCIKISRNLKSICFVGDGSNGWGDFDGGYCKNLSKVISYNTHLSPSSKSWGFRGSNVKQVRMQHMESLYGIYYPFYSCNKLTDVSMPSLSSSCDYLVGWSHVLKKVTFENMRTINHSNVFIGNAKLDTIKFNNLSAINKLPFVSSPALTCLDLSENKYVVQLADSTYFQNMNENFIVKVPQSQRDSYLADEKWSASFEHPEEKIIGV